MTKKEKEVLDNIVNARMLLYREANNGEDEQLISLSGSIFFFAVDVREALRKINIESPLPFKLAGDGHKPV